MPQQSGKMAIFAKPQREGAVESGKRSGVLVEGTKFVGDPEGSRSVGGSRGWSPLARSAAKEDGSWPSWGDAAGTDGDLANSGGSENSGGKGILGSHPHFIVPPSPAPKVSSPVVSPSSFVKDLFFYLRGFL